MTSGVKIGLLAVIAALLGIVTWKLVSKSGDEKLSQEMKTGQYSPEVQDAINRTANSTGKAEPNTFYATDAQGNPDYTKPLNMNGVQNNPTQDQPGAASANRSKTVMAFEKIEHDFGTIKEGDQVTYSFKFTNTGKEPLIIEDAKGSCGCTVPKFPKEPIPPGKSDVIEVSFNSTGKPNQQTKTVTITANTEPIQSRLTIKANVLPKDPNAAPGAGH